jgi:hypothetical protein
MASAPYFEGTDEDYDKELEDQKDFRQAEAHRRFLNLGGKSRRHANKSRRHAKKSRRHAKKSRRHAKKSRRSRR